MKVGITNPDLAVEDTTLEFVNLVLTDGATEDEFREMFRRLYACDYVLVSTEDTHAFHTGIIVGYCLSQNIPLLEVGSPGRIHGHYAEFQAKAEWQAFAEAVQDQDPILVRAVDSQEVATLPLSFIATVDEAMDFAHRIGAKRARAVNAAS